MARLPTLDGLRGLAAIAVMLLHWSVISGWSKPDATNAYLAVDLFFALSGFVVASAYMDRLRAGLGAARFIRLRIIRLAPMHVLGQVLGFVLATTTGLIAIGPAMAALGPGLLLIPTPVRDIFPLNGPAWSLFWELGVNVLFVLLLPFLTVGRLLIAVAISALLLVFTAVQFGNLDVGWELPHFLGGAPRVLFSFTVGVLIHRFKPAKKTSSTGSAVLCAVTIGCFLFGAPTWMYDLPVVMIVFPAVVYFAVAWQPDGMIASACRFLGELSYPLYVLHVPVLFAATAALRAVPHDSALDLVIWIVALTGLVVTSWWIGSHVDPSVQAFLRRQRGRRQAA
jgi:peptidoglycan/LPS O-acetylase OafA/YrhL